MAKNELPENKRIEQKSMSRYLTLVGGAVVGIIALPFSVVGLSTIASALTITSVVGMIYGSVGVLQAQKEAKTHTFNEIKTHGTFEQQEQIVQLEKRISAFKQENTPKMYGRAAVGIVIASGVGIVSTAGWGIMAAAAVLCATHSQKVSQERKEINKHIEDSTTLAIQIRARRAENPKLPVKKPSVSM